MQTGKLILIPVPLQEEGAAETLTQNAAATVAHLKFFVVENVRTARRMLRQMGYKADFETVRFYEMGKHADLQWHSEALQQLKKGNDVGLLSEAGNPCIADPGHRLVALAHEHEISVKALSGPSSILLALISSGMSGQQFTFNGYLPIDEPLRIQKLKEIERLARKNVTQLFMEVPHRNNQLMRSMLQHLQADTKLCVASELSGANEQTLSRRVADWRKTQYDYHKRLCVFVLGV